MSWDHLFHVSVMNRLLCIHLVVNSFKIIYNMLLESMSDPCHHKVYSLYQFISKILLYYQVQAMYFRHNFTAIKFFMQLRLLVKAQFKLSKKLYLYRMQIMFKFLFQTFPKMQDKNQLMFSQSLPFLNLIEILRLHR